MRARIRTSGWYDRLINYDIQVLTISVAECENHDECKAGNYCDKELNCRPCENCPILDDALDGRCSSCSSPSLTCLANEEKVQNSLRVKND